MTRPLLLLDIDGPLNPYAAKPHQRPEGYTTHRMKPASWVARHTPKPAAYVKPLRVWLNPQHGPALLALPFDLVWCTTWMAEANEWIAPHLGLPELPHIGFPADQLLSYPDDGTHWKTRTVVEYAAGRPFVWVDDEINQADEEYVAAHHPGRALLHHVHPAKGLLPADFETLTAWAAEPHACPTCGGDSFHQIGCTT